MATIDSAPVTPPTATTPQPRYVPGAPPPAPPSKKSKKKGKSGLKNLAASAHEAALTDHAPDADDIKAGKVDPALLVNPPPPSSGGPDTGNNTDADEPKSSAESDKSLVVEAISKRIKALGKKVQRINEYKGQSNINEDQKSAIAGLPHIEASIKELESIKKTVEGLEASTRRAQAQERVEQRRAADQRVEEARQHAEAALLPRATSLLSFLALRNILTHNSPTDLSISEPERNAIVSAGDTLLAHPPVGHVEEIVKGFLSGAGTWDDIEYARILEITSQFAAPRTATPMPDEPAALDPTTTSHIESQPEEPEEEGPGAEPEPEPEPEPAQPVVISSDLGFVPQSSGGGFHFMQESELDVPVTMSESQEWVSVPPSGDVPEGGEGYVQSEDVAEETEVVQAEVDIGIVGTEAGGAIGGADAAGGAPLDWAATGDEGDELPDLGGLQATFGGSGSATPIAQPAGGASAPTKSVSIDDDGFTAIPSRRGGHGQRGSYGGRGRGGEGYRGRGGFRGGEGRGRGGSRNGGEGRGGYQGDGEGRGRYRGDGEGRGGYRSGGEGGEGGYRGRGRGGYGGQGEGEGGRGGRGGYRGRGEGRGSYRGRGGSGPGPATPTPEAAA